MVVPTTVELELEVDVGLLEMDGLLMGLLVVMVTIPEDEVGLIGELDDNKELVQDVGSGIEVEVEVRVAGGGVEKGVEVSQGSEVSVGSGDEVGVEMGSSVVSVVSSVGEDGVDGDSDGDNSPVADSDTEGVEMLATPPLSCLWTSP